MSDGVEQRGLTLADIPAAVDLSAEAGWNQVAADWRLMIEHGDGFGFAADGRLVATGLTVVFGGPFAWISMILVMAAWRRRGLATRLMRLCIDALQRRGLAPALDASPEGRQVYLPLGFRDVYGTTRMFAASVVEPPAAELARGGADVRPMRPVDLPAVAAYDAAPFGADRAYMLEHLFGRQPQAAFVAERAGRVRGFVLARDGRACAQIGPLVADDADLALALLAATVAAIRGPVCLDLGDHHAGLRAWLDARGFVPVVSFTRMILGRGEAFDDPARIFVIAGPELG